MSFKLNADQLATLARLQQDKTRKEVGMAKWELVFDNGSHSTMLSDDCRDKASAFLGAIERFGSIVVDVK